MLVFVFLVGVLSGVGIGHLATMADHKREFERELAGLARAAEEAELYRKRMMGKTRPDRRGDYQSPMVAGCERRRSG